MDQQQPETEDLYELLQVNPSAEAEVIEAAYRVLARRYHPDVNASTKATAQMARLNAAWERLRDPVRRAEYDRQRGAPTVSSPIAATEQAAAETAGPILVLQPDLVTLGRVRRGSRRTATIGVYTEPPGIRVEVAVSAATDWLEARPTVLAGLNQEQVTLAIRTRRLSPGLHRGLVGFSTSWETRGLAVEVEVVSAPLFLHLGTLARHGPSGAGWRAASVTLALSSIALLVIVAGLIVLAVGR